MQGSGTDPAEISKIREVLASGSNYCGRLLNYKKDGAPFWNLLTIAPIKDEEGNVLKFIGYSVTLACLFFSLRGELLGECYFEVKIKQNL